MIFQEDNTGPEAQCAFVLWEERFIHQSIGSSILCKDDEGSEKGDEKEDVDNSMDKKKQWRSRFTW